VTDTHKFYLAVLTAIGAIIGNVAQAVKPQQQQPVACCGAVAAMAESCKEWK